MPTFEKIKKETYKTNPTLLLKTTQTDLLLEKKREAR